jgi:RNA polymerase sigma-70 factor (ECF subfamily)
VNVFPELPDESRDFLRRLVSEEEVSILRRMMQQLGDRCRQLLEYSGLGYSPGEIAEEMGFSSARSASSQRYKCLEKLKELRNENARYRNDPAMPNP